MKKLLLTLLISTIVCFQNSFSTSNLLVDYSIYLKRESLPWIFSTSRKVDLSTSINTISTLRLDSTIFITQPTYTSYKYLNNIDLSNCIVENINPDEVNDYNIYPNPVSSILNIKNYTGEISLINQPGKEFKISGNGTYSIDHLADGLYILSYYVDGETIQESTIIK